jgi:hypothetical protein
VGHRHFTTSNRSTRRKGELARLRLTYIVSVSYTLRCAIYIDYCLSRTRRSLKKTSRGCPKGSLRVCWGEVTGPGHGFGLASRFLGVVL